MMTTINEWREETREIIAELLDDGSNPESEYTIEHHFACHNFDRLEKLAVELFKADFEVNDAEEVELEDRSVIFCFDASKDGPLDETHIMAQIESLLPLCEKFGVDYDGWGTYFEE
jgi:regulator of RNase E activity RraB